jgi:hypothetical protein
VSVQRYPVVRLARGRRGIAELIVDVRGLPVDQDGHITIALDRSALSILTRGAVETVAALLPRERP